MNSKDINGMNLIQRDLGKIMAILEQHSGWLKRIDKAISDHGLDITEIKSRLSVLEQTHKTADQFKDWSMKKAAIAFTGIFIFIELVLNYFIG